MDWKRDLPKNINRDGIVITLIEYKRGFIINREYINRMDKNGLKQGIWKIFYDNGIVSMEGNF